MLKEKTNGDDNIRKEKKKGTRSIRTPIITAITTTTNGKVRRCNEQ